MITNVVLDGYRLKFTVSDLTVEGKISEMAIMANTFGVGKDYYIPYLYNSVSKLYEIKI